MDIYVVKPGDSIYTIGRQFGVSPEKIIRDNEITNPGRLVVGQSLVILRDNFRYTVVAGDSLYSIARKYGTTVQSILDANPQITNPSAISPGQVIIIPPTERIGTLEVNGYAFPNINLDVLRRTLPYLTYLSIFSYQVRPDGSLSTINDTPLIQAARAARVAPLMVITNIEEGGSFSSQLARTILTNQQVQDTLINNVIETLRSKNYYGLDIDFEYIFPEDREEYNNFLRKVVARLRPLGYTVTSALAPKTSADQPGLLYEAHDYPVHGALLNHVILMTYEWGYTYGPPKAVAPINEVIKVLNYAVTAIPRDKILMGIPNYGYDWTLPYVKGTAARSIANTAAVDLAARYGAVIRYDEKSQAPFFNYFDASGRQHVVWFEDARSMDAKLRLVNRYNLGGVSYWTINRFFPQNWLVLNSLYRVEKKL
ncbi:spore germination protein YaaH [Clostridium homopropionicum DSM 5847]|uniref:Spore germination protein YaaH n=1 Tax=Clostridium homopropionicum DSM 5847 TaxID=1121318 RepID=A0A0L6ZCD8_9CLOT|nr:LysM peptidoglycan-binding domain-containing protein [Clostridium homopropionicum]KOA20617.1 spore germination protein YaaH [Clostridium homopropionicum DSM 5847]SFF93023.1 spore germination protein [Clostridium homopropionicum]